MFCYKCGDPMIERDGTFWCERGQMDYSLMLARWLRQLYAPGARTRGGQSPDIPRLHDGLRWHCPGCGGRLDDRLACDACQRAIRHLAYSLIELHPHRGRPIGTVEPMGALH